MKVLFVMERRVDAGSIHAVANHIRQFWEPRFRRQLVEYGQSGGAGLHDLVKEALLVLTPSTSPS